jgi:hypothetical protein
LTSSGINTINDTLINTTSLVRVNAVYVYTLTANGCVNTQNVVLSVDPQASPVPVITTHSPDVVCANTLYQNFGTSLQPSDPSTQFVWTATNATVYATGSNDQYSLINFPTPGNAVITVTANVVGYNCFLKDTFAVTVNSSYSDQPSVLYLNNIQFVCLPSDEDTYQWGYDNAQLDSTILTGEVSQDYVNSSPDFSKYYWVITTRNGCMQKTYYNAPVAVVNVNAGAFRRGGDDARDVAVGDQHDPRAGRAHLGDQFLMTRAVEDAGDQIGNVDALGLGECLEVFRSLVEGGLLGLGEVVTFPSQALEKSFVHTVGAFRCFGTEFFKVISFFRESFSNLLR